MGLEPLQLSCSVYQKMIDRGWRRSGTYCYKPDLRHSCCPQYTIKLDALAFDPSKSNRKLVNRFNRFVLHGDEKEDGGMDVDGTSSQQNGSKKKKAAPKGAPFSLTTSIYASERQNVGDQKPAHNFEVTLEPSSFTDEKFELYKKYQSEIHHDQEKLPSGFARFLVDSPLVREKIRYPTPPPAHLPTEYGAYHQMYRLDGALIAVGVLDILPTCVSSVYFMYDKAWERFSLGKLSALREAALAREIHDAGIAEMNALYMGFYIHSCQKSRYKGEYAPSYLADPETYEWYPLKSCVPLLEQHRYACFSNPARSTTAIPPRSEDPPRRFRANELKNVLVVVAREGNKVTTVPVAKSAAWRSSWSRSTLEEGIAGLGLELSKEVILTVEN